MSEPMSAVEIEDVLSSIRRLVSEDLRPTHKLVSAALQNGASKLILTPALRVVSNDQTGYVHQADTLDDPGDLQSVLDGIDVAEQVETVEIVPMFGSVRLQEMADVRADSGAADDSATADANFLASAMSRINGLTAADPAQNSAPETIEAVVAAVGAAVGPDEWELDGGEPAPQAKAWADTVWNNGDGSEKIPDQNDAAAILVLSDPVVDESILHDPVAAKDPSADHLSDPPMLGANVGHDLQQQTAVPDPEMRHEADLVGQDSIVFHDDDLAQTMPQSGDQDAAEKSEHGGSFAQQDVEEPEDGVGYLNEDLLRDIVRDMIQAELQGTLGERITRNVRKLVRSEINRALASRDYE